MMRFGRQRWWWIAAATTAGAALVVACAAAFPRERIPVSSVRVVATYPHDAQAFTQGLVIDRGELFEGTGQEGRSSLRKVDLQTGRVEQIVRLNDDYFGEGLAILGDRIYQLTWKNRLAIVYDRDTLQPVGSFRYTGEGWGLTTDGQELIMSDGSHVLKFLNPKTFEVTRRLEVRAGRTRVDDLNELEYMDGEILANVWYSDRIARISPKTGEVTGWLDLSRVYPAAQRRSREHVLNGIAYDATAHKLFVTGKNWPALYEIEIIAPGAR